MSARAAPAPVIEYGEILRKNCLWFACRARFTGEVYVPDPLGLTLMYFPTEQYLLAYFKGFHQTAFRVPGGELAAARTRWLTEREKAAENEF